jgi:hypothetical protein
VFEPDTVAWKWIVGVAAATILVSGALSLAARCIVVNADAEHVDAGVPAAPDGQLERELFDRPSEGLREREAELERLRSWGWVDRDHGIVHMPIERAMELVVQQEAGR